MNQASNVEHVLACVGDFDAASNGKTRATAEGGSKKGHFYKPLPKEFRRDGFTYRQIYREGDFAIYPKAEAWGVDGFTLPDKDAAFAKLREISR